MKDPAALADAELEARKDDLRYLAQMLSLEGLALSEPDREEYASIEREIAARAGKRVPKSIGK